jgi:hypothetical protein
LSKANLPHSFLLESYMQILGYGDFHLTISGMHHTKVALSGSFLEQKVSSFMYP